MVPTSFSKVKWVSMILVVFIFLLSLPFVVSGLWYFGLRNINISYNGWKRLYIYRSLSTFDRFYSRVFVKAVTAINPKIKTRLLVPESKYPMGVEMKNKKEEYEYSWMGTLLEAKLNLENKNIRYFTVKMDSGETVKFISNQESSTLWEVKDVYEPKWTYKMKDVTWTLEYFKVGDRVKVLFKADKDYATDYKKRTGEILEITNMFVIRI